MMSPGFDPNNPDDTDNIRTRAAAAYYDYLKALSNMERAKGTLVSR
jgi:hypothetical protein